MKKLCILGFTAKGKALAVKLEEKLDKDWEVTIFPNDKQAKEYVGENFNKFHGFLFISAAGIAVRTIAAFIKSKDVDPAVMVMDEDGNYIIPILSGHLGGSNEMALEISTLIGATPVITTATDINKQFAVDNWAKKLGLYITDISKIKDVSAALLNGEEVGLISDFPIEGNLPKGIILNNESTLNNESMPINENKVGICLSLDEEKKPFPLTFNLVPKVVTLGVGCRRDIDIKRFETEILKILEESKVSINAIEKITSIDIKKNEEGILKFCEKYQIPFQVQSAEELTQVSGEFKGSDFVKSVTGVDNVCERSCKLGSNNGKVILKKTCGNGVTAAMAMKDWKCKF